MAMRKGANWEPQQASVEASAYPTPDQIAEFLEANRKGGAEAIANLLREKQAQAKVSASSVPTLTREERTGPLSNLRTFTFLTFLFALGWTARHRARVGMALAAR